MYTDKYIVALLLVLSLCLMVYFPRILCFTLLLILGYVILLAYKMEQDYSIIASDEREQDLPPPAALVKPGPDAKDWSQDGKCPMCKSEVLITRGNLITIPKQSISIYGTLPAQFICPSCKNFVLTEVPWYVVNSIEENKKD